MKEAIAQIMGVILAVILLAFIFWAFSTNGVGITNIIQGHFDSGIPKY